MEDVERELEAMKKIAVSMDGLEPEQKKRVLKWATDRFSTPPARPLGFTVASSDKEANGK